MVNNVKPGYVNPLTMMGGGKDKQKNLFHTKGSQTAEKKQRALEAEKQSIENSLLLMKGTSGDAGSSKENIELLEKKLEEITKEIGANRQKTVRAATAEEKQAEQMEKPMMHNNFDIYERSAGVSYDKSRQNAEGKSIPPLPSEREQDSLTEADSQAIGNKTY